MKKLSILFLIAPLFSVITAHATPTQQKPIAKAYAASSDRQMLERNCQLISSRIAEQFAGMGAGALSSSGFPLAVKQEITQYLTRVGTAAAKQFLMELQQTNFRGYIF